MKLKTRPHTNKDTHGLYTLPFVYVDLKMPMLGRGRGPLRTNMIYMYHCLSIGVQHKLEFQPFSQSKLQTNRSNSNQQFVLRNSRYNSKEGNILYITETAESLNWLPVLGCFAFIYYEHQTCRFDFSDWGPAHSAQSLKSPRLMQLLRRICDLEEKGYKTFILIQGDLYHCTSLCYKKIFTELDH